MSLPVGYYKLKYIQSNGNQYISNIHTVTENTKVELKYEPDDISGSTAMFGYAWSGNCFLLDIQGNKYYYHGNSVAISNPLPTVGTANIILFEKDGITIDGVKTAGTDTTVNQGIGLFAVNNGNYKCKGKMYYFKVYEGDEIVKDFVPCVELSTGKYGMYETINGVFYGSSTTTNFIAGELDDEPPRNILFFNNPFVYENISKDIELDAIFKLYAINIGEDKIKKIYIGEDLVPKAYLGENVILEEWKEE